MNNKPQAIEDAELWLIVASEAAGALLAFVVAPLFVAALYLVTRLGR